MSGRTSGRRGASEDSNSASTDPSTVQDRKEVDRKPVTAEARERREPLRLSGLTICAGEQKLLDDVNLTIAADKITVIVGASGAGKSVLLRTLAGLISRDGDELSWQGQIELGEGDGGNRLKRRVGVVFQQFALFDELSPTANVQFAIDHRLNRKESPAQTASEWLDELGVPLRTRVAGLSGGQKQRLAIARTLAADPSIVLYDEPTSGLDAASGAKVAELIRETHASHRRTSIIVTHDYETLIPVADEVLLLDHEAKKLISIPRENWAEIPDRMKPGGGITSSAKDDQETAPPLSSLVSSTWNTFDDLLRSTGSAVVATVRLPFDALPLFPRFRWGMRFFAHYLRLVGGPSAWIYLLLAGMIIGFTSTYFTFRFLPFRLYTQPLLIDELLASIGFALYRVLVPVLATILIAARCGAAITADVGVKQYGGQVDAMRTLGIRPQVYLLVPIIMAFVVATPLLEWVAFTASEMTSLATFSTTHPEVGPHFWGQHFFRNLITSSDGGAAGSLWFEGANWVLLKNLVCGVGTATIGYYRGLRPKHSAGDVSSAITSTVLWTTLYVLVVHFVVALFEF